MNTGLGARARSVRWVLRRAWSTSPSLLGGIGGATLVRSLIPAAVAWVVKSLIDVASAQLESSSPDVAAVMPWLWIGLALALLEAAAGALRTHLSRRLSDDLNLEVTTEILTTASELDVEFFENVGRQDSLQRARQVTGPRFMAVISNTFGTLNHGVQVVTLTAVLVVVQPWTLLVVALIGPAFLLMRWALARRQFELEYNRTTKRRWTQYFSGLLTNRNRVAETRLLALAPLLIRKHHDLIAEFRDQDRKLHGAILRARIAFALCSTGAFYGLLIAVTVRALDGNATLGDVAVFFGASARLRGALDSGMDALTELLRDSLQVSSLIEFFDHEQRPTHTAEALAGEPEGAIAIDDLRFAYPGSGREVLRGLSLQIRPGETVALVGENGCGKSTLVKLIACLYRPDSGRITLDGRDLAQVDPAAVQRQIAFIFQGFGRYEASAADNIAYGDWERCLDDRARVEEVAKLAGVHEMIAAMPDGYDTLLGRSFGTHELSGGQWQKLAMARAFARPSSILILDEPTAALDARQEYDLYLRAKELARDKTTILISHRFSTVTMADRILVMDEGRIIEEGSHAELVRRGGHYAELYRLHQRQMGTAGDASPPDGA